jgi:uncharacterized membrane protein
MLILLVVLTGLMAGIYLAFSAIIMKSLGDLAAVQAAQVMNTINDVILKTIFMPIFFGSTLWYAGLILRSVADWKIGISGLQVAAALIYIVGMFLVTAFGNVPHNNALKQSAHDDSALQAYWQTYMERWTHLNHIRTISCILACGALMISLI